MKRFLLLAISALVALAPGHLQAQTIQDGDEVTMTGVSSDAVVANWDNVWVGPYNGVLSSDPTSPALTLYCVDFANGVSSGDSWNVNVSGLQSGSDLSDTRLSGAATTDPSGSLLRYRKAAFLASLFDSWETHRESSGDTRRTAFSGLHAAIWSVMTPGFPNLPGVGNPTRASNLAAHWLGLADDAADGGFTGMNWAEWRILSDTDGGSDPVGGKQEYLTRTTVTPEPETWALMITGLLALGFFSRRRLKELGEQG